MNILKKTLLATAFVSTFGAASTANAEVITRTYDYADTYFYSGAYGSFQASIKTLSDAFVVGFDTLNSAVLSIFLRDDQAKDNETYKFTLGSTNTQTFSGNNLDDVATWTNTGTSRRPNWEWVYTPGSVVEKITFNAKALADLGADGLINIGIESLNGDFIFEKAVLTADITRGASETGGSGNVVPEPATVALFGMGLLGFAASRRKAAKK